MTDTDGPFVGAEEARQILGIKDLGRITRWRLSGKLPPPYSTPKCSPVWFREDIERWRDGAVDGFHEPPDGDDPILGTKEAAELLAVDKSQIGRWRRTPPQSAPRLPEPVQVIKAGPLWEREKVLEFAQSRREYALAHP